ncbi:uncharacterized protein LOC112345451 [Selaginella moellendorffii]|uniref:uncharacterized protein LOC112345451 n=1 Tax=Selaginella moellendorffii TaxID=88036 RepID=UPI000D1C2140|nr:uncharacterized protein LOC112345451 [Selaginella moellendorffii]|eukprot:XP_024527990.1 uncharacterized protein LOC112345451 [Selaginella moellendorffii]
MAEAREARRQRILRRGADRLAFITGECKSLVPDEEKEKDLTKKELVEDRPASSLDRKQEIEEDPLSSLNDQSGDQQQQEQNKDPGKENGGKGLEELDLTRRPPSQDHQPAAANPAPTPKSGATSISPWKALLSSIESSRLARAILAVAIAVTVAFQSTAAECGSGKLDDYNLFAAIQPTMLLFTTSIALVAALALLKSKNTTSTTKETPTILSSRLKNSGGVRIPGMWGDAIDAFLAARRITAALSADLGIYVVAMVCAMACARPWICQ